MADYLFGVTATAVLVFLAASTGAGVVAAHFLLDVDGLGLGTLAGLLACGLVHSALGLRGGRVVTGLEVTVVATGLPCFMHVALLTDGEAGTDEEGRDFAVDFKQHFLEEVETLELVNQEGVFLLIAGILDTGLQFVEFA